MSTQAPFALRGRNPDVLTSIANLSNDEVFTPPEFANRMLDTLAEAWAESNDGANIWADSSVTFLDPFTKSGVFLREITKRLVDGLVGEIPNLQDRVNHVLTKQVFGIGITELTSLLARRSVYCSKWANGEHSICTAFDSEQGNIWFERTEHTWVGGTEKVITMDENGEPVLKPTNGKCNFCGANQKDYERGSSLESYAYPLLHFSAPNEALQERFGQDVRFDVVIGNPPYQLGQSGGDSVGGFAMPVYQKFVEAAKTLEPRYITMVTPSRWFAGGRGLEEFRQEMLGDKHLTKLVDFPESSEVFPGVDIKGGVSFFIWDASAHGPCEVVTVNSGVKGPPMTRHLDAYDVLIRRNEALGVLEKTLEYMNREQIPSFKDVVSPIQPFSIRSNFRGSPSTAGLRSPIVVYQNGGLGYMERDAVPRNAEWIDKWKVFLPRASGSGNDSQVIGKPLIAGPGTVCTETYLAVGVSSTEQEARFYADYLCTRFARFLVSLRKYTQDLYSERFLFVPLLPMDRAWSDQDLFELVALTQSDIEHVQARVTLMEKPHGD